MTTVVDQEVQVSARRGYAAPQLVRYGSVSDLTAGGSGTAAENNQGGQKPKP